MLDIIKWCATICIIVATGARAVELHSVDLIFGWIGTALWLLAAYKMRETALVMVNVVCLIFISYGLVR